MAEAVEISGPHSVAWDTAAPAASANLGYTMNGAAVGHEKFWENIATDQYGAGTSRDAVFTGEQVFVEFTLVEIVRSVLDRLAWNDGTVGVLPTIGRLASILNGTNAGQLSFKKEGDGVGDFVFKNFIPLEIVQELSHRDTKVTIRGEALLVAATNTFFTQSAGAHSGTTAVEVNGATDFEFAGTDIGYSESGARLTYRYEWDFVTTDDKGGNTHRNAIFQGMRIEVETNGDVVSFDRANVDDMQWHGVARAVTGVLGEIGTLATATEQALILEGPAVATFLPGTLHNARLVARADTRIGSKQTRFSGRWECFPKKAAPNLKRFYTRAAAA